MLILFISFHSSCVPLFLHFLPVVFPFHCFPFRYVLLYSIPFTYHCVSCPLSFIISNQRSFFHCACHCSCFPFLLGFLRFVCFHLFILYSCCFSFHPYHHDIIPYVVRFLCCSFVVHCHSIAFIFLYVSIRCFSFPLSFLSIAFPFLLFSISLLFLYFDIIYLCVFHSFAFPFLCFALPLFFSSFHIIIVAFLLCFLPFVFISIRFFFPE